MQAQDSLLMLKKKNELKDTRKITLFMWMKGLMFQRFEKRGALGTRMVEMEGNNFDVESSELLMLLDVRASFCI